MTKLSKKTIDNMEKDINTNELSSFEELIDSMSRHFFEKGFDIETTKDYLKHVVEENCNLFDEMNKETLKDLEEDKLAEKE